VEETVAYELLDDCQVAELVTSCVDPSDNVAMAVSCVDEPTEGVAPAMLTEETVLADVVVLPHAAVKPASVNASSASIDRPAKALCGTVMTFS
jgi:hypothetical protein